MSHNTPEDLKYSKEHEWTKTEGDVVTIGITDFAQSALGDIVFVEVPEVGTSVEKGASFGVVESIKSVSELYSPVSGEVVESNGDLDGTPESINSDAYGSWMVRIKISNPSELDELMDASAYAEYCQNAS